MTWQGFIKEADEKSIWQIKKYLEGNMSQTVIPTLDDKAASQAEKVNLLKQVFFPAPPCADLTDISNTQHSYEVFFQSTITI